MYWGVQNNKKKQCFIIQLIFHEFWTEYYRVSISISQRELLTTLWHIHRLGYAELFTMGRSARSWSWLRCVNNKFTLYFLLFATIFKKKCYNNKSRKKCVNIDTHARNLLENYSDYWKFVENLTTTEKETKLTKRKQISKIEWYKVSINIISMLEHCMTLIFFLLVCRNNRTKKELQIGMC